MREVAAYEARRRLRGSVALAVGLGAFAAVIVAVFPSIEASGVDFEAYIEALPPAFATAFGVEAFATVEGFLAAEFYQFVWVLLLGLYTAYAAASAVAGVVEDRRVELVLSAPLSRRRYLLETYLATLTPVVVANVVVYGVVLATVAAIGESVAPADLAAVHLLSVPYLLATAAVGLAFGVAVDRAAVAERGALGVVFLLFVLESVVGTTDFEWLALTSPTRYYDPTAVLVRGEIDWVGAGVLLVVALALLGVAVAGFERRDL